MNHGALAPMTIENLESQLLTEIDLRFSVVLFVWLELDHIKFEMIERPTHAVESILCFSQNFIKPIIESPCFLFFC